MRPSLALACLAGLASAVVLPPKPGFEEDGKPLVLKLVSTAASVAFAVPCPGCLGEGSDDEALLFDFQAFPTEEPCGASNLTLNGNLLTQTWDGTHAEGQGTLSSFPGPMHDDLAHDLELSWESSCLYGIVPNSENAREDVAQVLTVIVQRVDGKDVEKPSGFTISFKSLSEPQLLRLSTHPDFAADEPEFAEDWRDPPAHLRLTLADEDFEEDLDQAVNLFDVGEEDEGSYIEGEIEELKRLHGELRELQYRIEKKQNNIRAHYYNEYQGLKDDIAQCDSLTCVLKTIVHKAHGAIRTMYIRFRPGPPGGLEFHRPGRQQYTGIRKEHHDHKNEHDYHHPHGPPPPPPPGCPPMPPPHCMPPPPMCHGNDTHHPGPHHPPPHHRPGQGDGDLPLPPPPPPPPPPHHGDHPPPPPGHHGPPPPYHDGPPPPHHGEHHEHGEHHHHPEPFALKDSFFPNELPPRPHPPPHPALLTIEIIAGLCCCTLLFTYIRRKCCTARARVERLARREERRTAREFRRAARRQAWREWWDRQRHWGNWRWHGDYEEKRALILEQEGVLEECMQEEIRQLRAAHDVVNSLVSAEEGRSSRYTPASSSSASRYVPPMGAHPGFVPGMSRPPSRTNSLPDYRSEAESMEPPAYEEDADSSDVVVDGFREYTPSSSSASQWTPESSVIDVSPRQSCETLRESARESCSIRNSVDTKN